MAATLSAWEVETGDADEGVAAMKRSSTPGRARSCCTFLHPARRDQIAMQFEFVVLPMRAALEERNTGHVNAQHKQSHITPANWYATVGHFAALLFSIIARAAHSASDG